MPDQIPLPSASLTDLLTLIGDREVTISRLRQQVQQYDTALRTAQATIQRLRDDPTAITTADHADPAPDAALR